MLHPLKIFFLPHETHHSFITLIYFDAVSFYENMFLSLSLTAQRLSFLSEIKCVEFQENMMMSSFLSEENKKNVYIYRFIRFKRHSIETHIPM